MTHNFINEEMALATKLNTPKKERNISRPLDNLFYAIHVVQKEFHVEVRNCWICSFAKQIIHLPLIQIVRRSR